MNLLQDCLRLILRRMVRNPPIISLFCCSRLLFFQFLVNIYFWLPLCNLINAFTLWLKSVNKFSFIFLQNLNILREFLSLLLFVHLSNFYHRNSLIELLNHIVSQRFTILEYLARSLSLKSTTLIFLSLILLNFLLLFGNIPYLILIHWLVEWD